MQMRFKKDNERVIEPHTEQLYNIKPLIHETTNNRIYIYKQSKKENNNMKPSNIKTTNI